MEHPLHTITYVADIDSVLVIMARRHQPQTEEASQTAPGAEPEGKDEGEAREEPQPMQRMTCHVLESGNVSR